MVYHMRITRNRVVLHDSDHLSLTVATNIWLEMPLSLRTDPLVKLSITTKRAR